MNTREISYTNDNHKIISICNNLKQFKWQKGVVAGVYDKCFNILTENRDLVTIFKNTDMVSTRAMISDVVNSFNKTDILNNMPVVFKNNIIYVGKSTFNLTSAEYIDFKRDRFTLENHDKCNIKILENVLCRYGKQTPLLTDGCIKDRFSSGFDLLKTDLDLGIKSLVGLGIGLTPSCDDVLAGMSAYFYLTDTADSFICHIREYLNSQGDKATTVVSKNLLCDITEGIISDTVYNLIYSILFDSPNIEKCARRLLDYGSTSGTETCLGIIYAHSLMVGKEKPQWL